MVSTVNTGTQGTGVNKETVIKTASSNAQSSLGEVNFDTFVKLLLAQLKNQDPLNPMEGTEFTNQLATFSQLEQQMNTNTKLDSLLAANNFGAQSLGVSYIGKEALVDGNQITLGTSGKTDVNYTLDNTAFATLVEIRDSSGVLVRELEGGKTKGLNTVAWDGKAEDGTALPAGTYKITVSAYTQEGEKIKTQPKAYARVTGVESGADGIMLVLADGKKTELAKVQSVREKAN
jgi:flagellar basal-body rod modification protein FlgD